jgi:hypothetical protein
MTRKNTKIGDVFTVKIDGNNKRYFQYVVSDLTQLNSDVIRSFETSYAIDANPSLSEIVNQKIDFYAHCATKIGLKLGYWEFVGNSSDVGKIDALFKSTSDDGNTEVSENWWIWKANEEQVYVGKLRGENRSAEIGSVMPPDAIVYRMRTGKYNFIYPSFE